MRNTKTSGPKPCGRWLRGLVGWWAAWLVLAPAAVAAPDAQVCQSPRAAVQQFLDNLQPDQFRPTEAIRCF